MNFSEKKTRLVFATGTNISLLFARRETRNKTRDDVIESLSVCSILQYLHFSLNTTKYQRVF